MRKKFPGFLSNTSALLISLASAACVSTPSALALSEAERDFDLGCNQMMQKHFKDAIGSFTAAISEKPGDPNYYFRRGQCFMCLQNLDEAILDFERAINAENGNPQYYLWRGSAYAKQKKDESAIRDYEKAMRLDPGLTEAYRAGLKGKTTSVKVADVKIESSAGTKDSALYSQESQSETKAAPSDSTTAVTTETKTETADSKVTDSSAPDSKTADSKTAATEVKSSTTETKTTTTGEKKAETISLGASDDAVKDYAEAYERAMKNLIGYFKSGTIYSGMLAPDGSEIVIGGYKRNPELWLTEKKNGADFYSLKNASKDMRDFDSKITESPNSAELYFGRALAYEQLGNKEQALADFSRAIDLDKKNAYYALARAYYQHQLGKEDLAKADIKLAQEADPSVPVEVKFEKLPARVGATNSASAGSTKTSND